MTRLWTTFLIMLLLVAFGAGSAPRPCMAQAGAPTCVQALCSCHADKDHELREAIARHRCLVPAADFAVARPAPPPDGGTCAAAGDAHDLAPPAAPTALAAARAPAPPLALAAAQPTAPRPVVAASARNLDRPPRPLQA